MSNPNKEITKNMHIFIADNITNKKLSEKQIKALVIDFIDSKYKNVYSKNNYFTRLRNHLGYKWDYPKEWIEQQKQVQDKSLMNREVKKVPISIIDKYINKNLDEVTDHYEKLFILQLISGRRLADLLDSDWEKQGDKIMYIPKKKRQGDKSDKFELKIIIGKNDKNKFYKHLGDLKEQLKNMSIDGIRKRLSSFLLVNNMPFTNKNTRDIYANYATKDITNSAKKVLKIKDLLNHDYANSSVNYAFFELVDDKKQSPNYCDVCKVEYKKPIDKIHLNSKKHMKNMEVQTGQGINNNKWYCDVCMLYENMNDKPDHLKDHLHIENLEFY